MIIALTGLPGSGKTYTLAEMCDFEIKKHKREVYANFALAGAHYFEKLEQVLNVQHGIIAVDELNTLCPASKWQSIPTTYINLWTQSRHNGVDLWYTTQNFRRVIGTIRDVTNFAWRFGWYFPRLLPKLHWGNKIEGIDAERETRRAKILQKRVFYERAKVYKLYDTTFHIKTPDYLQEGWLDETDPANLPTFDNSLNLVRV